MQFFMFLTMVFTMLGFGTWVAYLFLSKFTAFSLPQIEAIDEHSPASLVMASLMVQGIASLFIFSVSAFLFAYLTHPKPLAYLGLRAPGKKIQLLLVIGVMLGAMPIVQQLEGWISHIDFGTKVKASQAVSDNMMSAFLNMPDFTAFIRAFVIMAIIPAVGEEMFFRGILLRFTKKKSRNMIMPILFTALVFSYSHANIYGYLSIFLAGVLLAVIYNLTGSLWCSILAHLFFNGLQIILSYASNTNATIKAFMTTNTIPAYLVIGGAVLFTISFYFLLKNKTPLPPNWTDDFTPEELAQGANT
jgi:membrane protease YdiL (CAAX protease family)